MYSDQITDNIYLPLYFFTFTLQGNRVTLYSREQANYVRYSNSQKQIINSFNSNHEAKNCQKNIL